MTLLSRIDTYLTQSGMSERLFGRLIVDNYLLKRLRDGKSISESQYKYIDKWLNDREHILNAGDGKL